MKKRPGSAEAKAVQVLPLFERKDGDGPGNGDDDGGWEPSSKRRKALVGWPPVKSTQYRRRSNSGDGLAIGRKVDQSLHSSYAQFLHTLRLMFPASN